MIEDLMKLKKQIDTMIETYKDLHPDEEDENHFLGRGVWESNEVQQERALKKIREGNYENKFSKSKRKEITGQSQGQSTLCVYGDT
tara:strand:+ start:2010 stop:2267 length:258 start_codon:yes stop_codon:yes gene_type:complete